MTRPVLTVLAAALVSGCASLPFGGPPNYVPQPGPGQEVRENRHAGGFSVQSLQARSAARVQQVLGDNLEEHGALFKVVVLNTGEDPVSFGLGDIEAEAGGKALAILDRAKLAELEEAKKSKGDAMSSFINAGAVVGGILSAAFVGYSGGGNLSHSQIESSSQSIAGGMVASMEAGEKAKEGVHVASEARLELFDKVALQATTLQPGMASGGYFVMQGAGGLGGGETLIRVRVGTDAHEFRFKPKLF